MNNRGQTMIIGIMILIMAVIVFIATIPALKSIMNNARACYSLNCAGYVEQTTTGATCSSTNGTYNPGLEEDTLACTIVDLGIPYLILAVLVGLIAKLIHGKLVEPEQPQYSAYDLGY